MFYFKLSIKDSLSITVLESLYETVNQFSLLLCSDRKTIDVTEIEWIKPDHDLAPHILHMHGAINYKNRGTIITLRIYEGKPVLLFGECKQDAKEYAVRLINYLKNTFTVQEMRPEGATREESLTWEEDKQDTLAEKKGAQVKLKGGRPRNPDDDWAYDQVYRIGRTPNEVYPEWCERIGPRVELLVDSRDSFYHALHYRKSKEDTEKTD